MLRTSRTTRALGALAALAASALIAFALAGGAPINYDTAYGLAWGAQLTDGRTPDLRVPLAPTPKPLLTAVAIPLTALGPDVAEAVTRAGAFAALGALALIAGLLASQLGGGRAAALGAWALVLTRVPVLSFGARAYVDVPYCALVLGALAVELRRPRAGVPALALLAVAGLLRPEAWLLSILYAAYCAPRIALRRLAPLALAAPTLWLAHDAFLAGDPLWSLTGTRATAQVLDRSTGLGAAITVAPRRIGEIVREPVLVAALLGLGLAIARRRRADLVVLVALAATLGSFVALATAGLPALGRYLMLPALLLVIVAASGVATGLPCGGLPRAAATLSLALVAVLALPQARRLADLRHTLRTQSDVLESATKLLDRPQVQTSCGPYRTPNHRLVPLVALHLGRSPAAIVTGVDGPGSALVPRSPRVARLAVLDPRDPAPPSLRPMPGARRSVVTDDWMLTTSCGAT